MDINEFQNQARGTDQIPYTSKNDDGIVVPLLGIAGEIGTLQAAYKKKIRDGDQYRLFESDVAEELGDILWYVSNLADKFDLKLGDVLKANLKKVHSRWPVSQAAPRQERDLFDHTAPDEGKLPRTFAIEFRPLEEQIGNEPQVQAFWSGSKWGSELGDNAYEEDGYRFHDVMHLANAAVLGWSPVARKFFGRKRKHSEELDRVEDSGRAIVIEEGAVAFVYGHASKANYFANAEGVDWAMLKTIRNMTNMFEVSSSADWEWERAILTGYSVWRELVEAGAGIVVGDLYQRTLRFEPAGEASAS